MNAPTAWDEERLVRQDYDELPDEVLARVAAHQLLKGID